MNFEAVPVKFELVSQNNAEKVWKVEAIHVTTTANKRKYTKDELTLGARSLSFRPMNINHDESRILPYPKNSTLVMDFDATKNGVAGEIKVAEAWVNSAIETGRINKLSIEQSPTKGEVCSCGIKDCECEQHGIVFTALALLENGITPGDPATKISKEMQHQGECPPGQHMVDGKCVPKEQAMLQNMDGDCNPGYHKDPEGKCVKDEQTKYDPACVARCLKRKADAGITIDDQAKAICIHECEVGECACNSSKERVSAEKLLLSSNSATAEQTNKDANVKMPGVLDNRIVGFTPEQFDAFIKNSEQKQIETLEKAIGVYKTATEKLIEQFTPKLAAIPSSKINAESGTLSHNKESAKKVTDWIKSGHDGNYKFTIDKHEFLRQHGYNPDLDGMIGEGWSKVETQVRTEAITSGTQPIVYNRAAIYLPGGRMRVPIRQYTNFTGIAGGADRAAYYTMTSFDFVAITEGTAPTEAAPAITQETAVPDTRGAFIKVKYSQIEDNPFPLVEALNNRAALAAVDNEGTEVLDTSFNAATMATGFWINGNTGANLTADDVSGMTLTITGVSTAKKALVSQGYGVDVAPVFALHPKAYHDIIISSGIDKFVQQGIPEITRTGMLESILGVQLLQTDNMHAQDNTTNDTYRNVMFLPGDTFGLAASRDLTIKAEEHSELQQLYWVATHRIKAVTFNSSSVSSAVRVSTAQ